MQVYNQPLNHIQLPKHSTITLSKFLIDLPKIKKKMQKTRATLRNKIITESNNIIFPNFPLFNSLSHTLIGPHHPSQSHNKQKGC